MPENTNNFKKYLYISLLIITILIIVIIFLVIILFNRNSTNSTQSPSAQVTVTPTQVIQEQTTLDLTKLPLGDQKYTTTPKVGYIYLCNTNNLNGGGAFSAGPWIDQQNKTWDETQKVTVNGNVDWPNAVWSITDNGTLRQLKGNGLPDHTTGEYPINSQDDAYLYDRNPNSIKEQTVLLELPTIPTITSSANCMGGEVGIMLSGVALFNGFDAGGRDAAAWEVQDDCNGHPQVSGQYHYHSGSDCIDDHAELNEHSDLIGYALDGFGIFGKKGENGKILKTSDLDECHGHTHTINWDNKEINMYHYHITDDFPYSVSCFKAKPVQMQLIQGGQGMQPQPNQQRPR